MGARRSRSMARNFAGGGSSRWASQPSRLMGDSARGSSRRRMRPRRRPSARASSPPPSKVRCSLVKRGGHCAAGSRRPWAIRRTPPPAGAWKPPVIPKWKMGQGRRSSSSQRCLPCRRTAVTRRPRSARAKRAGLTPSKTMGSGAHCTDVMRRAGHTLDQRAAASTSGNSGYARVPPSPARGRALCTLAGQGGNEADGPYRRAPRRVQRRGAARGPGGRRTLCTLTGRSRAATKPMGPIGARH